MRDITEEIAGGKGKVHLTRQVMRAIPIPCPYGVASHIARLHQFYEADNIADVLANEDKLLQRTTRFPARVVMWHLMNRKALQEYVQNCEKQVPEQDRSYLNRMTENESHSGLNLNYCTLTGVQVSDFSFHKGQTYQAAQCTLRDSTVTLPAIMLLRAPDPYPHLPKKALEHIVSSETTATFSVQFQLMKQAYWPVPSAELDISEEDKFYSDTWLRVLNHTVLVTGIQKERGKEEERPVRPSIIPRYTPTTPQIPVLQIA